MFKPLSSLFKSTPHSDKSQRQIFDFLNLIKRWPEIVGANMAKHTIPLKLKNNCLYVLSNHSAFSGAVSFMEEAIKNKIAQTFPSIAGSIKKLNFQVNSRYFNQEIIAKKKIIEIQASNKNIIELHPYSPEYKELKKKADSKFEDIQDNELKQLLTSIFIQSNSNK